MGKKFQFDLSVVLPSMNEGDSIRSFYQELLDKLEEIGLSYEVIAIDTPTDNDSYSVAKEFAQKYDSFTAISLAQKRKAGSDKTVKYMIGFELAKGRYIIQMDTDGQDDPADLPKFIEKLDEGFDLVVGHKQNRKDTKFYMLQSKLGNALNRFLTGSRVHDMNCGFKGYQSHVAKSLNLKGRWYRLIPAFVLSSGFKVTEVPIHNRKRKFGKTNFNFSNRLQSGFDLVIVAILIRFSDTPMYFWGWLAILMILISLLSLIILLFDLGGIWNMIIVVFSGGFFFTGVLSALIGISGEFRRYQERFTWDSRDVNLYFRKDNSTLGSSEKTESQQD